MNKDDNDSSNIPQRRSFITGAGLLLAGASLNSSVEAVPYIASNSSEPGLTIPIYIPLDGYVKVIRVTSGDKVKAGDIIVETESIDINRTLIQVNTAIALVDSNAEFMLGEYMTCVKNLLTINQFTNSQFEEKTKYILDRVKSGVEAGMRESFELTARELSVLRAEGESRRSKLILDAYEPELEQLKFRFSTLKQALQNELKIVQDMQNRMRLLAPTSGIVHLMVGTGSFVPKGGYVALVEVQNDRQKQ